MTFLDFFAGVGGFRLGMEMSGHKCLGHCENDKYADKSYRAMHDVKEDEWYADDIRTVRANEIPRVDCWCFGFPCQDISVAGKQTGFKGNRSSLFFAVTKLIRELEEEDRPSTLFIENVKNLFSVNGGFDFLKLLIELDEIGYDAEWQLLNSKDFGVPQNRERVFIIGHLRGRSTRKVFPICGTNKKTGASIQILAHRDGYRRNSQVYNPTGSIGALDTCQGGGRQPHVMLEGVNVSRKTEPTTTTTANCLMARDYKGIGNKAMTAVAVLTPDREEKRQNGRRMKDPGEPMFTLTSQDKHGVAIIEDFYQSRGLREYTEEAPTLRADRQGLKVRNNMRIRRLTPKECFRLQGFPDEYFERAAQVNSCSQLYKQAGNSVTVNVIYEIAQKL